MKKHKVIISGGGTGGHIFPALAIAKELEKKYKEIDLVKTFRFFDISSFSAFGVVLGRL